MTKNSDEFRVVLVHTPCSELEDDRLEPPLGLLYLATILEKNGIDCTICDLSGYSSDQWQSELSKAGHANVYGFSTYSVTYFRTLSIKRLAEGLNPNALFVAGGPHASAMPKETSEQFDVVIRGEAEEIFLDTVRKFCANRIKPIAPMILQGISVKSLDDLPFPDYGLVDLKSYRRIVDGESSISLLTSRGCSYNCTFCNSLTFMRGVLRFRSPQNVVNEIVQLMEMYGTHTFRFNDDLFTFSRERIREMTKALTPLNIRYRVFARSNTMTVEASKQLAASGCKHVAIGIESMSRDMLRLMDKRTTVEENIAALFNCKAAGLAVRIYLLIGFPGETEATVNESLRILMDCPFDEFVVYAFIPYPGTAV